MSANGEHGVVVQSFDQLMELVKQRMERDRKKINERCDALANAVEAYREAAEDDLLAAFVSSNPMRQLLGEAVKAAELTAPNAAGRLMSLIEQLPELGGDADVDVSKPLVAPPRVPMFPKAMVPPVEPAPPPPPAEEEAPAEEEDDDEDLQEEAAIPPQYVPYRPPPVQVTEQSKEAFEGNLTNLRMAQSSDKPIVLIGGVVEANKLRWIQRKLGLQHTLWLKPNASEIATQVQRLHTSKLTGIVVFDRVAGKQVNIGKLREAAKLGGVPYAACGTLGSGMILKALEELEAHLVQQMNLT